MQYMLSAGLPCRAFRRSHGTSDILGIQHVYLFAHLMGLNLCSLEHPQAHWRYQAMHREGGQHGRLRGPALPDMTPGKQYKYLLIEGAAIVEH